MIIPMIALKVRDSETETLTINFGTTLEFNEASEISFPVKFQVKGKSLVDNMRLDLEVSVNSENKRQSLGSKVILLKPWEEQKRPLITNLIAPKLLKKSGHQER